MTPELMPHSHQPSHPGSWPLGAGEAGTLAAAPRARWLRVESGRLWVTARDGGPHAPDHWLQAGDSLALPPGTAWVLEAWPSARASVLEAAPRRQGGGFWAAWRDNRAHEPGHPPAGTLA